MDRYICEVCGYVYEPEQGDPDHGVAPGTPFASLPPLSTPNPAGTPR